VGNYVTDNPSHLGNYVTADKSLNINSFTVGGQVGDAAEHVERDSFWWAEGRGMSKPVADRAGGDPGDYQHRRASHVTPRCATARDLLHYSIG